MRRGALQIMEMKLQQYQPPERASRLVMTAILQVDICVFACGPFHLGVPLHLYMYTSMYSVTHMLWSVCTNACEGMVKMRMADTVRMCRQRTSSEMTFQNQS